MTSICVIPKATSTGGVTSFQAKLGESLARRGIQVVNDLRRPGYDAVLLTGGVRDLIGLLRARRRGVRIVQRLDGINWLHRRLPTGMRHFLRAEYGNRLLAFLRARLVTHVVYQSEFVRGWWQRAFGPERVPSTVIYNGVDLSVFNDTGRADLPSDRLRLLLVEGSLQGGYETGLDTALRLAELLGAKFPLELMVAGRVASTLQAAVETRACTPVAFAGLVPRGDIPSLDRSAHLLYSADLNAACPNSVIEALACGLPVVAFATGALPEIVIAEAGLLAPYGGDPWKLEEPDLPALAAAAETILHDLPRFRLGARRRAEAAFGLDRMVDSYLKVLLG